MAPRTQMQHLPVRKLVTCKTGQNCSKLDCVTRYFTDFRIRIVQMLWVTLTVLLVLSICNWTSAAAQSCLYHPEGTFLGFE